MRWFDIPISFRILKFIAIYIVKGFSVVKEEVDIFF